MKIQDAELGMWVRITRGTRPDEIGQIDTHPDPVVMLKMLKPDPDYPAPFYVAVQMKHLEPCSAVDLLGELADGVDGQS